MRALLLWWKPIPPEPPAPTPDQLCFTANTAGSTVQLTKTWSPTVVSLETSTDWNSWTDYTIWNTITLSNIWDKVYWRNKSETDTWFSTNASSYYKFVMTWSIAWSGDINYLLNKNSTDTVSGYCYYNLFKNCDSLTTVPELPATTLGEYCYRSMFQGCTALTIAPELPATILAGGCYQMLFYWCTSLITIPKLYTISLSNYCYYYMFNWCTNLKLSTTQDLDYTQPYRIPTTWIWVDSTNALKDMFTNTWWTFTWDPTINTTYYVHKDNVIV